MDFFDQKKPYLALLYGKKFAGKSNLISLILQATSHRFHDIYVWSFTKATDFYQRHGIPEDHIFDELDEDSVRPIFEKCIDAYKQSKGNRCLLIFDDILGGDVALRHIPSISKIASLGRHFGITAIMASQQVTGLPPVVRNNGELVLIMNVRRSEIEKLADIYAPRWSTKKEFLKFIVEGITMGDKERSVILIDDKKDEVHSVTFGKSDLID